jgi:hypothetical protein
MTLILTGVTLPHDLVPACIDEARSSQLARLTRPQGRLDTARAGHTDERSRELLRKIGKDLTT